MNKTDKSREVAELTETLRNNDFVYLADASGLTANQTNKLRGLLYESGVSMRLAKNTLINLAMQNSGKNFGEMQDVLKGSTYVLTSDNMKAPAIAIKKFRKATTIPSLKGAWIDNSVYIGDSQLEDLINLKSREELIGGIISLLQSPAKNVISALQSNAGQKLAGLVKAIEEKKS